MFDSVTSAQQGSLTRSGFEPGSGTGGILLGGGCGDVIRL